MQNHRPAGIYLWPSKALPILACSLGLLSTHAEVYWGAGYSIAPETNQPPAFYLGSVFPSQSGYVLMGRSALGAVTNFNLLPSAARLDEHGHPLWSVVLADAFEPGSAVLQVNSVNHDRVNVGYLTNNSARIGMYNTANPAESEFSFEIPLLTPNASGQIHLHLDPNVGITEDQGTAVHALVLTESGEVLFDKQYASPLFTPLIPEQEGTSTVKLFRKYNDSGFVLFVQRATAINHGGMPPPSLTYSNTLITVCLNTNGSVRWSHADSFTTRALPTPVVNFSFDGSILLTIGDFALDMSTFSVRLQTLFIKLSTEGELAWARTAPNTQMHLSHGFNPTNDWASGAWSPGGGFGPSDFVVAKLDPNTGEILAQAVMHVGANDNGQMAVAYQGRVYFALDSYEGANQQAQTGLIGYLDHNLQNPVAVRYNEPVRGASLLVPDSVVPGRLLYSAGRSEAAAIDAVVMSDDLADLDCCNLFTNATVTLATNVFALTNLTVTRSNPVISVEDVTSSLTPTNINIGQLALHFESLCDLPDVTPPELGLSETETGFVLLFESQAGVSYEVLMSPTTNGEFQMLDSMPGTGSLIEYPLTAMPGTNGFYRVLALPD